MKKKKAKTRKQIKRKALRQKKRRTRVQIKEAAKRRRVEEARNINDRYGFMKIKKKINWVIEGF